MSKNYKIESPWFQKDIKLIRNFLWARVHKTTYAPVNLTALCIIFSGGQFSLRGDWALKSREKSLKKLCTGPLNLQVHKELIHNLHLDPAGYYWPGRCISHFNAVPLTRQLCDCALYYIICMGLYHDSLHQCFTFIFWKNISPVLPVLTTTVHIFQ